jgi:pyruvate/2-oxoglutarate dehydrogenase complex dihydrolipoamide acyltransferase (E2) component
MQYDIKVPPAGEAVKNCRLVKWHKEHRALVKAGECIATLETDKISLDLEAEYSGALLREADEGSELNVGQVFGTIDEDGVSISDLNKVPFMRSKADKSYDFTARIPRIFLSSAKIFLMALGLMHLYKLLNS